MLLNIKEIDHARKTKLITLAVFAEKIGITTPTYNNLVKSQDFRLSHLRKMSEILEIPFFELFEEKAKNSNDLKNKFNHFEKKNTSKTENELQFRKQENENLKKEIRHLEEKIKDIEEKVNLKDEIIELLKSK